MVEVRWMMENEGDGRDRGWYLLIVRFVKGLIGKWLRGWSWWWVVWLLVWKFIKVEMLVDEVIVNRINICDIIDIVEEWGLCMFWI